MNELGRRYARQTFDTWMSKGVESGGARWLPKGDYKGHCNSRNMNGLIKRVYGWYS